LWNVQRRTLARNGTPPLARGPFHPHMKHLNLETTRGYAAVFPDHVIRAHEEFIERRRTLRVNIGEYREPTAEEWAAFEKHFLLRTVALGDCGRPYGTPCVHEHACVRCPFLRMDPAQLPRLNDIESNTRARLDEARRKTWLGEVAALEESLAHIARKRSQALELLGRNNSLSAVISE
jgi:hypothetical protein